MQEAVKELIDEIQAGSAFKYFERQEAGQCPMCAYLEHVNLRKIIYEVSTNWLTSETWDLYFIVLCIDQGEIYDVEEPNVKAPEYLGICMTSTSTFS